MLGTITLTIDGTKYTVETGNEFSDFYTDPNEFDFGDQLSAVITVFHSRVEGAINKIHDELPEAQENEIQGPKNIKIVIDVWGQSDSSTATTSLTKKIFNAIQPLNSELKKNIFKIVYEGKIVFFLEDACAVRVTGYNETGIIVKHPDGMKTVSPQQISLKNPFDCFVTFRTEDDQDETLLQGTTVRLKNFTGNLDPFNGQQGTIRDYNPEFDQYNIQLGERTITVKPENLEMQGNLPKGAMVTLQGLKKEEYNGKEGIVERYIKSGRYQIVLSEKTPISVKLTNLNVRVSWHHTLFDLVERYGIIKTVNDSVQYAIGLDGNQAAVNLQDLNIEVNIDGTDNENSNGSHGKIVGYDHNKLNPMFIVQIDGEQASKTRVKVKPGNLSPVTYLQQAAAPTRLRQQFQPSQPSQSITTCNPAKTAATFFAENARRIDNTVASMTTEISDIASQVENAQAADFLLQGSKLLKTVNAETLVNYALENAHEINSLAGTLAKAGKQTEPRPPTGPSPRQNQSSREQKQLLCGRQSCACM